MLKEKVPETIQKKHKNDCIKVPATEFHIDSLFNRRLVAVREL